MLAAGQQGDRRNHGRLAQAVRQAMPTKHAKTGNPDRVGPQQHQDPAVPTPPDLLGQRPPLRQSPPQPLEESLTQPVHAPPLTRPVHGFSVGRHLPVLREETSLRCPAGTGEPRFRPDQPGCAGRGSGDALDVEGGFEQAKGETGLDHNEAAEPPSMQYCGAPGYPDSDQGFLTFCGLGPWARVCLGWRRVGGRRRP